MRRQSSSYAFDQVLTDCEGDSGKNWSVVRDIAVSTMRRREQEPAPAAAESVPEPVSRGRRVDTSKDNVCLVTGASGFIGGRLTQRLVRDGYQVRCIVRASSDTVALEQLGVELAVGDLTAPHTLAHAAQGCRYVFHCGAMVSDWATPKEVSQVNVTGTRNLLSACADASVQRFVHFSTTDVYGYPGGGEIEETYTGTGFSNWYAQTKLAAEMEVRRLSRSHNLESVILRPATVYGPGSREVVLEIARAIRSRKMVLIDRGRAVAGLVFVDNL